ESSSIDVAWAREARDVFDPDEVRRIAAHDSGLLGRTFWTRKEALVKLHGVGLTASLARIRVGDVPPHGGVVSGAAPGWVRDLGGALGLDTHAVALACDEPPETIDLARLEPRQLTRDRADQDSISNSTRSRISP
ncbi:MAG TPA: 4'-phosphopantetheinyl transferase superfamily protein, partial [Actinopolymorphaceae bacterium]